MTKSHLVPCAGCSRHVRVSEEACPFCGARLPVSLRQAARPLPPTARLTRAALFAFGTGTMAVATAACSSSSNMTSPPPSGDDTSQYGDDATAVPFYGSAAGLDGSLILSKDAAPEDASGDATMADAGDASQADAGDGSDAGIDDDSGHSVAPLYGIAAH